ncbi:hypothetical protein WEI85_19810 [Actinomycetes bacterium KLBMP 9797]
MGYTHYWSVRRGHPGYAQAWPGIVGDARRIIDAVGATGVAVAGPNGYGQAVLDLAEGIAFNGDGTAGLDYEAFRLGPPAPFWTGDTWAFCKTAGRPYDLAVTAVLLRCRLLLPRVVQIQSDGRWDDEWLRGAQPALSSAAGLRPAGARALVTDLFGAVPTASPFDRWRPPGVEG